VNLTGGSLRLLASRRWWRRLVPALRTLSKNALWTMELGVENSTPHLLGSRKQIFGVIEQIPGRGQSY
jgi:hypothetical protein